jgi:hypothetical protein
MEINQNLNYQKHTTDLSQLTLEKHLTENGTTSPQVADSQFSTTPLNASAVNISEKGRTASFAFDFNATKDNLSKLNTLGSSESFAKAHASISYEKVKNLLA